MKIMVLVDAQGLPVAVDTMSAAPHESTLVQETAKGGVRSVAAIARGV